MAFRISSNSSSSVLRWTRYSVIDIVKIECDRFSLLTTRLSKVFCLFFRRYVFIVLDFSFFSTCGIGNWHLLKNC